MANFYLDENIPLRFVELLEEQGHHAITTRDLGQEGADDHEQLLTAALRGWIFLTHDRKDFIPIHQAWLRWFGAYRCQYEFRDGVIGEGGEIARGG